MNVSCCAVCCELADSSRAHMTGLILMNCKLNVSLHLGGTELWHCCFSSGCPALISMCKDWSLHDVTASLLSGIMYPTFLYLSYFIVCCAADKLVHPRYTVSLIRFALNWLYWNKPDIGVCFVYMCIGLRACYHANMLMAYWEIHMLKKLCT